VGAATALSGGWGRGGAPRPALGSCLPPSVGQRPPELLPTPTATPSPRSEATIAKRRSYANTISYLTPPAENAGLYKGLKELKELISSYQSMRDSGRAEQITATIIETARQCNLDKDVALPAAEDATSLDQEARDLVIGNVYRKLMEIESRLLPCGLHVVGVPPTAEEAVATLVNIGGGLGGGRVAGVGKGDVRGASPSSLPLGEAAICERPLGAVLGRLWRQLTCVPSIVDPLCPASQLNSLTERLPPARHPPPELDRPDQKPEAIFGLPGILARAIGRDIESIYTGSNKGVLADVDLLQRITEASRKCVREFVRDRTGGWLGGGGAWSARRLLACPCSRTRAASATAPPSAAHKHLHPEAPPRSQHQPSPSPRPPHPQALTGASAPTL
jgi:hypothetical protein